MSMILVELIILVLIPLEGFGLDLPKPLHKVFILDLYEHLGYMGIEKRQYLVGSARWSLRTLFINSPPSISLGLFTV